MHSNVLLPYVFFLKIVLTPPKQHQRSGWRILIPRARFILVLSDGTWVRISLPRFWSIQDRRLSVGECVYRGWLSDKSNETNWIWEEWPRRTSLTCGTNTRYSESKPELSRLVFFPVWFKSCIVLVFLSSLLSLVSQKGWVIPISIYCRDVTYVAINSLPWCNIFDLDINFPPWWNIF